MGYSFFVQNMSLGPGVAPELRSLIEAIEAWPSNVHHAQAAAQKASGRGRGGADATRAEEATPSDDAQQHVVQQQQQVAPRGPKNLSSSLRAPATRHLSSMVSQAPQRGEEWRHSVLGPGIGPGSYATRVQAMRELGTSPRPTTQFLDPLPQRPEHFGLVGDAPRADGMYAHSMAPAKVAPRIRNAVAFRSTNYRFDDRAYLESVRMAQQPAVPRREIAHWHGAPLWEGPFKPGGDRPTMVLPTAPGPDHAERLAAARASQNA